MFLTTTVSVLSRSISVLLEDGRTERFSLARSATGDVRWRHDVFGAPDATGQAPWLHHGGRLTVAEVLARVPHCESEVRRWTREEVEAGPGHEDDIFIRLERQRALERLAGELETGATVG